MDGFQAKTISKKNIDIDKNIDFGITLKILGDLPIGIENIRMFDRRDTRVVWAILGVPDVFKTPQNRSGGDTTEASGVQIE